MTKVFLFPGQGSQQVGMGKDLFHQYPNIVEMADSILQYSIKDLCLNDPENNLTNTRYSQVALFVVNALNYLHEINESRIKPDYVAGHSLGEYNALFASEVFDFEKGLNLVKKRGEVMSKTRGGGMAAVIGLEPEKIKSIFEKSSIDSIDIANYNSPSQTVISGPKDDIEKVSVILQDSGARMVVTLKVSGAFHSRYMKEAQDDFAAFVEGCSFNVLAIPVISNVTATPHSNELVKENLIKQMSNPVRWTESIQYLMNLPAVEFKEIGQGKVLTKLIKQIPFKSMTIKEQGEGKHLKKDVNKDVLCKISIENIGDSEFKKDYNLKYPIVTGSMYRGISSVDMVIKIAKVGMLGFFGTGGCSLQRIESAIESIKSKLTNGESFGMNLLNNLFNPQLEEDTVDLFLKHKINIIEASAYVEVTAALVRYRVKGLIKDSNNKIIIPNRVIAKVSRPEVVQVFLNSPPLKILKVLLDEKKISMEEYILAQQIPMADDITAESNSGGHTDNAVAYALVPTIINMRNQYMSQHNYQRRIRVGAAGGIGTPEALCAALIMGADYIVTGSINQCTVEADISDTAKDMLSDMNIQDTEFAPAADMFEFGSRVQVLKKGVFFPARANKLYELYKFYNSIDDIDDKTKKQIEKTYFKRALKKFMKKQRNILEK